jgi:hypothetical protein
VGRDAYVLMSLAIKAEARVPAFTGRAENNRDPVGLFGA